LIADRFLALRGFWELSVFFSGGVIYRLNPHRVATLLDSPLGGVKISENVEIYNPTLGGVKILESVEIYNSPWGELSRTGIV